jgi:hypothetical protein
MAKKVYLVADQPDSWGVSNYEIFSSIKAVEKAHPGLLWVEADGFEWMTDCWCLFDVEDLIDEGAIESEQELLEMDDDSEFYEMMSYQVWEKTIRTK